MAWSMISRTSGITCALLVMAAGPALSRTATVYRPGIMCRDATALAILTLPGGDSRTHVDRPSASDLYVAKQGGCVDLTLGATTSLGQEFKNTGITADHAFIVPLIDLSGASEQQGHSGQAARLQSRPVQTGAIDNPTTVNIKLPEGLELNAEGAKQHESPPSASLAALQGDVNNKNAAGLAEANAALDMKARLDAKLVSYVKHGVRALQRKGAEFDTIDDAFGGYNTYLSRPTGPSADSVRASGRNGFVGLIGNIFLNAVIVAVHGTTGAWGTGLLFIPLLYWNGTDSNCSYGVAIKRTLSDSLNDDPRYPCSDFLSDKPLEGFEERFYSAVAEQLRRSKSAQ